MIGIDQMDESPSQSRSLSAATSFSENCDWLILSQSAQRRYKAANDSKIYFNCHLKIYISAILAVQLLKKWSQ